MGSFDGFTFIVTGSTDYANENCDASDVTISTTSIPIVPVSELSYVWSASGPDAVFTALVGLNSADSYTFAPGSPDPGTYVFTVVVSVNGVPAFSDSFTLVVSDDDQIVVSFAPSPVSLTPLDSQDVVVTATSPCPAASFTYSWSYISSVETRRRLNHDPDPEDLVDGNTSNTLSIGPHELEACHVHTFEVTVSDGILTDAVASIDVTVTAASVVADIDLDDLEITAGTELELSAAGSVDNNHPAGFQDDNEYLWPMSCRVMG